MKKITKTLLGMSVAALLASCGCAQQQTPTSSSHQTGLSSSESSKQTDLSSSESTHQTGSSSSDTTQSSSTSESTQSTQSSESTQSTGTSESSQSSESSSQPASKVVTAIIGDVTITLNENTQTDKTDGRLAEYYAEDLDVVGGQSVIIKIDGVEISQNIGPDAYAEDNNLEQDELGNILVVNNAEDASLYFKVYERGYSLYLTGFEEEEETVLYNIVTDDEGSGFGLTESKGAHEGWDVQYESDKMYLSPLDYIVIKGVKDNSTFSYAQIDPKCQELFTNTDGKAYPKEAGDYTVYLKLKTVDGSVSASIWVNFTKDYDVDFTNIFMSYGEVGDQNPTVVTQKAETGTNEVRFTIPSAEAGTVVAFGALEEGQSTPLSVDADEDEGNNLEPLGGGNGSFSVKTGGTAIEVYLKAVGENQFKVWAAGYEDYRPDLYVRGTAVGGWDNTKYRFAVPTQEDQAGVIENIKLEEGEFKIASKDWSNSWGWWGYQIGDDWIDVKEEGQGNLVQGEARANFAAVAESNNIKCNVAGYYNLYMMKNNYLYITKGEGPEEEEKVFSVKLGEATPVALVENEGAALAENQTGEYMLAEPIDLTIGTVLEFYSDETKIAEHIGADEGSNVELNEGVYTIKASKADAQIYLKTWKDGGYSFYVEGPKADGVYLEKKVGDEYVSTMMAQDEEAMEGYDFSFRLKAEAEVGDIFRGVYVATFVEGIQDEDVYDGSNCIIETAETLEVEGNDIKVKAAGKYEFVIGIIVVDHVDTIHVYANPVNLTEVDFETDYDVGNGNSVYVVGNFTNWKIDPAFKLDYDSQTAHWKGTFEFADGDYEYKFVKAATEDPGTEVAQGNWLSPNNIEFSVPAEEEGESEEGYAVLVNETPIDIADIKEQGSSNAAVYKVPAEDEDEIQIKKDGEFLEFYHWDDSANEGAGGAVSEGNKITATAKGHYVLWVNTDGKVYYDFMPTDEGITAKKGDEAIQLTNSRDLGSHDRGVYVVTLATDDVVTFKFGDVALHFYENVEDEAVDQGASYTATADGEYTFYVNGQNQIYVGAPEDLVATNLYVKFGVADSDKDRVYAWVWSNAEDGAWYYATHVDEEWTAENNRHYTISLANPVGKKVIVASFSSESGVDDENEPDGVWTGKIKQSAEATIADWGANAN